MKYVVFALGMFFVVFAGCGDTEEEGVLLDDSSTIETIGAMKAPEEVAMAPQMPGVGTPSVTEVGFYHDWKLKKPITGPVEPGQKVFIKIVFSEPMTHIVSDTKAARPVLYYKTEGGLERFSVVAHRSSGKNFTDGDAKPLGTGTDDYICKYIVPEELTGAFSIMIGKQSADLEGNTLAKFYRHPEVLQVGQPVMEYMEQGSAGIPPIEYDYSGITHNYFYQYPSLAVADVIPAGEWIIDFPGPYREYMPPPKGPRDFVGRVEMPVGSTDRDIWGSSAPVSGVTVTILEGPRAGERVATDAGGYYLFKEVREDELYLRVEKKWLEMKEVIVHRSRPTTLREIPLNRVFSEHSAHSKEKTPGTILMGIRWPDPVRFILEDETMVHDVLHIVAPPEPGRPATDGAYGGRGMIITEFNSEKYLGELYYSVLAHELGHARQHAVALANGGDSIKHWENTPEAKAYQRAWEADLRYAEGLHHDDQWYYDDIWENNAEFVSQYWLVKMQGTYYGNESWGEFKERAPNRFKWAETYLNTTLP